MGKELATDKAIRELSDQVKDIDWMIMSAMNYIKEKQREIRQLKKQKEPLKDELARLQKVRAKL